MLKQIEGSYAVAQVVAHCRPHVISAYPITPQTHIVEGLADLVGEGQLQAEFVNVESEFSAASVVFGCFGSQCCRGTGLYGHNISGLAADE